MRVGRTISEERERKNRCKSFWKNLQKLSKS
mgnify:CR=1 FL=1